MFKKVSVIAILLIVNYSYLLPLWKEYVGNILGFILNTIFLFIILSLLIFYWFGSYIEKILGFNARQISNETPEEEDIDMTEMINLKEAFKDFEDIMSQPGTTVNIAKLSGLWKDSDNPKDIKEIILSAEEDLIIDMNVIKRSWRMIGEEDGANIESIENKTLKEFYTAFYNKLEELEIEIEPFLKDFFYYLMSLFDKYGNQPSVVDLKVTPRDPDNLKRNIRIGNTDLYSVLFSEVDLIKHSIGTVNLLFNQELTKNDKVFEFIVNNNGMTIDIKTMEMPKLDGLDFVFTVFTILAHDIGKASSLNFSNTSHTLASVETIKLYLDNLDIDEKYNSYIKQMLYAIESHHDDVAIKRNFRKVIKKEADGNVMLFYLNYADMKERYLERENIVNTIKNNQGLLEFVADVNGTNNNNENKKESETVNKVKNNTNNNTERSNNKQENKDIDIIDATDDNDTIPPELDPFAQIDKIKENEVSLNENDKKNEQEKQDIKDKQKSLNFFKKKND
jgi:hypothetical protein